MTALHDLRLPLIKENLVNDLTGTTADWLAGGGRNKICEIAEMDVAGWVTLWDMIGSFNKDECCRIEDGLHCSDGTRDTAVETDEVRFRSRRVAKNYNIQVQYSFCLHKTC